MNKEEFLSSGLVEQYVLKLTTPEENRLVERMLEEHPDIQATVDSLELTLEEYIQSMGIPPPPGLKQDIVNRIDEMPIDFGGHRPSMNGFRVTWRLLALTGILVFGTLSFFFYQRCNSTFLRLEDLQQEYATLKENCETAQSNNRIIALQNEFLKDENTKHVHLRGSDLAPEALVVAFWNPNQSSAYLKVVDLPAAPAGKAYQLWADIDGKMVNMQTIETEAGTLVEIPFMEKATSLNITLEDEGEKEHATVSQLYVNGNV